MSRHRQIKYETEGPITAIVEAGGAQVRVTASDRTDTVVQVDPIDAASRKDVKVAENTEVEFAGGRLSVKTITAGDKRGSVAITIDLPAGSGLAAHLWHSTVHANGVLGASELHMASGQVQLDRVDALTASIASGDVSVGRIARRAAIEGAAFTMRIGEVEGTVGLSNSGGQTWIGHAAADLDLESATSDFDIDRADRNVTARTASGAIRIGRMTNGRAKLTNGLGDIEVGISDGVAASIDVKSERGAVHDLVSAQGNSDPSGHKVMVHARTRRGDITVKRTAG
jgi:Putative adhesin